MSERKPSVAGAGAIAFAGIMMIVVGAFGILEGLVAIINSNFFVVGPHYTYSIDVTGWGWIHLILSLIVMLTGFGVISGQGWARWIGVVIVSLAAIANFLFIPYYPLWAILLVAIDIFILWALIARYEDLKV